MSLEHFTERPKRPLGELVKAEKAIRGGQAYPPLVIDYGDLEKPISERLGGNRAVHDAAIWDAVLSPERGPVFVNLADGYQPNSPLVRPVPPRISKPSQS